MRQNLTPAARLPCSQNAEHCVGDAMLLTAVEEPRHALVWEMPAEASPGKGWARTSQAAQVRT